MQGQDLSSAFLNGVESESDGYRFSEQQVLGAWHHAVDWRLVVDHRFKYVWNQGDLDELYDLEADPFELRNLIDDASLAKERAHLWQRLIDWMAHTADPLLPAAQNELVDS
jgi:arylsulfatase A-like enzyme